LRTHIFQITQLTLYHLLIIVEINL